MKTKPGTLRKNTLWKNTLGKNALWKNTHWKSKTELDHSKNIFFGFVCRQLTTGPIVQKLLCPLTKYICYDICDMYDWWVCLFVAPWFNRHCRRSRWWLWPPLANLVLIKLMPALPWETFVKQHVNLSPNLSNSSSTFNFVWVIIIYHQRFRHRLGDAMASKWYLR